MGSLNASMRPKPEPLRHSSKIHVIGATTMQQPMKHTIARCTEHCRQLACRSHQLKSGGLDTSWAPCTVPEPCTVDTVPKDYQQHYKEQLRLHEDINKCVELALKEYNTKMVNQTSNQRRQGQLRFFELDDVVTRHKASGNRLADTHWDTQGSTKTSLILQAVAINTAGNGVLCIPPSRHTQCGKAQNT